MTIPNTSRFDRMVIIETVTFASKYSTLGLYWGSMDTYNSIDFYNGGVLKETVTGSQAAAAVLAAAQGLQTDDANNRYIIISAINGGLFDKIVLNSTSNSFELDNLEWGPAQAPPGPTPLPERSRFLCLGLAGWLPTLLAQKETDVEDGRGLTLSVQPEL